MSIAIAGSIGTIGDTTSIFGTYTFVGGANQAFLVGAGAHQANVGTVLLNGTALTRVVQGTSASNEQVNIWYKQGIVLPGAGGLGTINAQASSGAGLGFVAAEFTGVSQNSQPFGSAFSTLGNSGTALGTLSTTDNQNFIFGGFYSEAAQSSTNFTNILTETGQSFENMGIGYFNKTLAGQQIGTWVLASGQRWASALVNIQPVGSITFDSTASTGTAASAATISWAHTIVAQSNGIIIAQMGNGGTSNVTSLKYAGTAMTKIIGGTSGITNAQEIWYLLNPPVGVGTFNGTYSANTSVRTAASVALNGVDQTTPIVGSVSGTFASATSGSVTFTTTNDTNWLVGGFNANVALGTADATTGQVERASGTATSQETRINTNGLISPAGLGTIRDTFATATGVYQAIEVNYKQPAVVASTVASWKNLMGVGQA